MSKKNDGGPAYPCVGEGFNNPAYHTPGMSLRDHFAGQAMDFFMADIDSSAYWCQQVAAASYCMAEAMLAERDKEA
jgi:hypothetical protein